MAVALLAGRHLLFSFSGKLISDTGNTILHDLAHGSLVACGPSFGWFALV